MTINATPGDAAADSYVTLAEADAYFSARGVATWTGADSVKENALRNGTAYLDNQYRGRWIGIATYQTQALSWPRVDGFRTLYRSYTYPLLGPEGFIIDQAVIPQQLKNAAFEAALLALSGVDLQPTLARGNAIQSLDKQVGPLRKSVTYRSDAPVVDRYLAIEGYLRGLVTGTPGASTGTVDVRRS